MQDREPIAQRLGLLHVYKDVGAVVDVAQTAGLARKVARLEPLIVVKG